MARVLVLRTGEAVNRVGSFTSLFARGLGSHITEVIDVDATQRTDADALESLDDVHGVVMTGSPAYVGDDAPWMRWGKRMLLHTIERDVPLLAVCFGHQLLGQALGCDVGPNPRGREMGTVDVALDAAAIADDPLLAHVPARFIAQCTHRDVIRSPSERVRVVGRAAHDGNHVVRAGKRAWGFQFHPEFDHDVMRTYLDARRDVLEETHGAGAHASRVERLRETPHAASLLARFAELCVQHREERARGA